MMERRCNGLAAMQLMMAMRGEELSLMLNEGIDFLFCCKQMLKNAEKMAKGS